MNVLKQTLERFNGVAEFDSDLGSRVASNHHHHALTHVARTQLNPHRNTLAQHQTTSS